MFGAMIALARDALAARRLLRENQELRAENRALARDRRMLMEEMRLLMEALREAYAENDRLREGRPQDTE